MKKITPLGLLFVLLCSIPSWSQSHTIYYENFDADNGNWASSTTILPLGSTGNWVTATTTIAGEGGYWRTNPFDNYSNNSRTYLTSPVISTAGFSNVTFYIDIRYKTEAGNDGMYIEYTQDILGLTGWTRLGSVGDGSNWYNDNDVDGIANNAHGWSGQNLEVAASPSKFIEASINTAILSNKNALRFRILFASNGTVVEDGVAIDNVILKGEYITAPANPTLAPGSIANNLKLWLKATNGTNTTADGAAITTWNDQASNNNAEAYGTFRPTFRNNPGRNINFNPVIDFDRNAATHMKGKGGYWSQDYYIVVETNDMIDKTTNNSQMLISGKVTKDNFGQDGTGFGFGKISSRFTSNNLLAHMIGTYNQSNSNTQLPNSYGRSYTSSSVNEMGGSVMIFNVKSNTSVTPNVTEIYLNGKRIDTNTGTNGMTGTGTPLLHSDFNNSIYQLGVGRFSLNGFLVNGVPFNTYLNGRITEVFSYSNAKTAAEQQKIQSYLAIKNGVTLHAPNSSTADNLCDVNYVDSNGTVIWNVATSGIYNYDIAGIGRDDASGLNQKQSKSENPGTVLTIGLGDIYNTNTLNTSAFATDRSYLLWGSNGLNMGNSGVPISVSLGPDTVTTITEVSSRKWKLTETNGDVGEVRVSIPTSALTNLPALTGNDAYVMVISSNPTFSANIETVFLKTDGVNQYAFYDFDGTKYITFGVAHETIEPRHASFDGVDDYIRVSNNAENNLNGSFTIMAWVRPDGTTSQQKTIISKFDGVNGYKLSLLNDNRIRFDFTTLALPFNITSTVALPDKIWHNIAITNDGINVRLYIDGVLNVNATALVPAVTTSTFSIGAEYRSKTDIRNIFKGDIDEVRIWNTAIPLSSIRYIMNQEILSNGPLTKGAVMPVAVSRNDISNLLWSTLTAYYSMNSYIGTHLNDDSQYDNRGSLIVPNNFQIRTQTAPLPYESTVDGQWSAKPTWKNGTMLDQPYSLSIVDNTTPIDWNIVKTTHNVISNGNKTVLGLFVNANTLNAVNDSRMQVSHYLLLDGKIDLVGRSQLVQTQDSDLDPKSKGSIERDQQGSKNLYNYNYWCSPVGQINQTTNNSTFTIRDVMRDGSDPNTPKPISWIGGYDGYPTNPISICRAWLYRFQNLSNEYANWTALNEASVMSPSQGYTMKGSGTSSNFQNYTFVGKPNNGLITNSIAANNLNLAGNPYASALDATAFINANSSSIKGTIYFWEHSPLNNSHRSAEYLGGYSTRNLTGGVGPVAKPANAGLGGITKAPGRYIPVGQGFFIEGSETGGIIIYNNNMRAFFKEDNANSTTLFRDAVATAKNEAHFSENQDDATEQDTLKTIRVGYKNKDGYRRELLLGFMNASATDGIDYGYDAENFDNINNDISFHITDKSYVIQGVGNFDQYNAYPLIVKSTAVGKVTFSIDEARNFDAAQAMYIFDAQTGLYHNIRNESFELEIPAGTNATRFSLRFSTESRPQQQPQEPVNDEPVAEQPTTPPPGSLINIGVQIGGINVNITAAKSVNQIGKKFTNSDNLLTITNPFKGSTVNSVTVFNILGQNLDYFDVSKEPQSLIQIPIHSLSAGTYILKIDTTTGVTSKKIVIK